jgi:hypothetical protein
MFKAAIAKLLTVKVAAILVGLGLGGVALAATTGVLPNPLVDTPTSHAPTVAPSHPTGPASANPTPSEYGLCQAYVAEATSNPGRALENPAFTSLVTAAGGPENLDGYCDAVIAAGPAVTPPGPSGAKPSATGKPAGVPTPPAGSPAALPIPTGLPNPVPSIPGTPPSGR